MRRAISTGLVTGTLLLTAAAADGSPRASIAFVHGGSGTLTLSGRVGPLQFDQSSELDVMAAAGQPDVTATGNFGAQDPDYFAMGYTCQEQEQRGWLYVDHFDYCRTIFYINTHTQLLTAFASSSRNYSFRGASPGMTSRAATRHIHVEPYSGCLTGFSVWKHHPHAAFFGDVVGGRAKLVRRSELVYGGHLEDLQLESNRYPVGLLVAEAKNSRSTSCPSPLELRVAWTATAPSREERPMRPQRRVATRPVDHPVRPAATIWRVSRWATRRSSAP